MKINGQTFTSPHREYCVLPRGESKIVFYCDAILSYDDFDRLCPFPEPPAVIKPGGVREPNFKDSTYLSNLVARNERRMAWMVINSIRDTPGLEWDEVDYNVPSTWTKWRSELKKAFFSHVEVQRIEAAVYAANCLNESAVQEARENFLLGLAEEAKVFSSLHSEPNTSQSGEAASDSESDPQT